MTRILPIPSSSWPCSRTSRIEPPECLSRFLTSARRRLEAAALSRFARRSSGVSLGSATGDLVNFVAGRERQKSSHDEPLVATRGGSARQEGRVGPAGG